MSPVTRFWRTACVVALSFLAGSEWHRVFGWGPVTWRVAAAACVPAVMVLLTDLFRPARLVLAFELSVVALLWFLAVGVLHDSVGLVLPDASAAHDIASAVVNGWAEVLSVPLPVPALGQYLVLPVGLTWLASLFGVTIVLRSRWAMAGALPAAVVYALSLLFGIGSAGSRLVSSGAFLAVTLLLGALSSRPLITGDSNRRVQRRRAFEAAGCLGGVVVLALVVGPSLPFVASAHPYDPRSSRVPPQQPAATIDPLDELSQWAHDPHGPPLLTVRWDGHPQSLRLAVLDHYDPLNGWTQTSRFSLAGIELPAATTSRGQLEEQVVHIDALTGPWLPAAEQPVEVVGARALVDPATGDLISAQPTQRVTYRVASRVIYRSCTLDPAVPFDSAAAPQLPETVTASAEQFAGTAPTPCARASELAAAFLQHFSYNPKAPSGSDIQVIENFLHGPKGEGGGTGTYEQAAAAYALMAEALGMRARVVVGFHAGHPIGHDTYVIRPDDAFAWDEVDFVGSGWVPFYPALRDGPTPPQDKVDQSAAALRNNPNTLSPTGGAPKEQATPAQLARHRSSSDAGVALVVVVIALGIVVLCLVLLSTVNAVVRRLRRKRRQRMLDPRRLVIGAWEESLDVLVTVGIRPLPSDTASEVVASGVTVLGSPAGEHLTPLGELSNQARFSDQGPQNEDAGRAWTCAGHLAALANARLGWRGRLRRAVDPRPLVRSGRRRS